MRSTWLLVPATLLLLCCSCTKDQADEGNADASSSEGTDTNTTETGSDACDGYVDAALEPPLQIVVRNTRAEPVYLMRKEDCTTNDVHVTSDAGHWPVNDCEPTCAQMIAGNCACPGACPAPQLRRVEAGGEYMLDWAFVLAPDMITDACVDPAFCGAGACPQAIEPPDGMYTISVDVLYAPSQCGGANDPCACPPGEQSCVTDVIIDGSVSPDLALDTPVTLPGGSLDIVIE